MKLLGFFLLIIEIVLFFIATLFGLIETGVIISFLKSKSPQNFGEKLLYSQFAEEIKSSYNRKFIPKIQISNECKTYQKELIFELKLNNKVTSFSTLFDKKFCIEESNIFFYNTNSSMEQFTYEYMLENYSVESGGKCPTGTKGCGILDTTGHILCLPESLGKCPLNDIIINTSGMTTLTLNNYEETLLSNGYSIYLGYNYSTDKKIFVYNFFSENNKPLSHEWRNYFVKDQYREDKTEYLKENKKYLEVRDKFDESYLSFLSNLYDKYYTEISIPNNIKLTLSDIKDTDINSYYSSNSNNLNIKWYYKNYIGFKNTTEFALFKRIFEYYGGLTSLDNDSEYAAIVILFVLIFIIFIFFGLVPFIAYIIKKIPILFRLSVMFSFYFTIIYSILYMGLSGSDEKLIIGMDDIYNEVLKFYNKRYNLKYLVFYVILFIIQIILIVVLSIIECTCTKKNKNNGNKPLFKKLLTFDLSSINEDNDIKTEGGKDNDVKVVRNEGDLGSENVKYGNVNKNLKNM